MAIGNDPQSMTWRDLVIAGQAIVLVGMAAALYGQIVSDIDANTVAISAINQAVSDNTTRSLDSEQEINRIWERVLGNL